MFFVYKDLKWATRKILYIVHINVRNIWTQIYIFCLLINYIILGKLVTKHCNLLSQLWLY